MTPVTAPEFEASRDQNSHADRLIVLGATGSVMLTLCKIRADYRHVLSDLERDTLDAIISQLEQWVCLVWPGIQIEESKAND